MNQQRLLASIRAKESYLCVGLDTDITKIPRHLQKTKDPVFEFNKQIIDATEPYAVAYKPNIAFYEALGSKGWESLEKTMEYMPDHLFTIADAKRGDIGNTSKLYAEAFFGHMNFDAITVAPYMGEDSVTPFLEFENKWVILLGHTSNAGSRDFQSLPVSDEGDLLYEHVIKKAQEWGTPEQLMFVVGATRSDKMEQIRALAPESFFLVPGVGAQGGSLKEVSKFGFNDSCGILVNSSRAIIYASEHTDFASEAGKAARAVQEEMKIYLDKYM
jgi:orotidine-5'-phosphate decarboxylase